MPPSHSPDPRSGTLVAELHRTGIRDPRVLEAMARTPREIFVEDAFAPEAWANTALPIACGQTISQPYVVAYMTEHLDVRPEHRVLEIGTGSGYQAAVLSPLCRKVYTVERHRPLYDTARTRFRSLGLDNVVVRHGDGFQGWPEQAPFDRILLACAVTEVPEILIEQLKPGGALIAPVGKSPEPGELHIEPKVESFSQLLTKMIRTETGVRQEALIPVVFVPMLSGVPRSENAHGPRHRH